jgi:inner membrane protein
MSVWTLLGLLAFSLAMTVATRWLVAALRSRDVTTAVSLWTLAADLIWVLLVFAAGVVATRYIERMSSVTLGFLGFGSVALLLSLARAYLYQIAQEQRKPKPGVGRPSLIQTSMPAIKYLLFAGIVYLSLSLLTEGPADPVLFVPVCLGALLPDLDSSDSLTGRLLPFVSRWLEARFGHCQEWHTLGASVAVALITAPLIAAVDLHAWVLIPAGFLSHLVLDMLQPRGIMLFWPLSRTRYFILGGPVESHTGVIERRLVIPLVVVAAVLLLVADVRRPPPPPIVTPSFESTLARYLSMRGRNLVFADVDGTWQVTGRRVYARFEILNAVEQSYIMLDRFTGMVFTAGRTSTDNLYLNRVDVVAGSSVKVKPVEVQLRNERLVGALATVYQMQSEPGLQHIFVSGEVILAPNLGSSGSPLQVDYTQTRLRRIQSEDARHFTLRYLSASDLIGLANTPVEVADLVIVASYAEPATGPTATPLPSPPPTPERRGYEPEGTP